VKEPNECAFCGKADPETRDHLPPKSFFPSPRPGNLITVPCCEVCRRGQSKDDETVRILLSLHYQAGLHPAIALLDPPQRLAEVGAWRYATYFRRLIRRKFVETPLGLVLPARDVMIEKEPFTRFLTRLTRGLHFHHAGERLPSDWTVYLVVEPMFVIPMVADILAKLRAEREINIGNGVFSYKFAILPGRTSGWLFKFYDGVELMTFAVPAAAQRPEGSWPSEGWLRSSDDRSGGTSGAACVRAAATAPAGSSRRHCQISGPSVGHVIPSIP
jgi:hypothetical protein